jgi:hypothetical protein
VLTRENIFRDEPSLATRKQAERLTTTKLGQDYPAEGQLKKSFKDPIDSPNCVAADVGFWLS